MNFFNFGDSPDRSTDTSFAFSFTGDGVKGDSKDDNQSSKTMFGSNLTADDSKTFSKAPNPDAPVLKKTKVEKPSPSPVKRRPDQTPEKIFQHEDQKPPGCVPNRPSKDDLSVSGDVAKEDMKENVDMTETLRDCIDDIRRDFSSFLPQLQAHKEKDASILERTSLLHSQMERYREEMAGIKHQYSSRLNQVSKFLSRPTK